jgi:thiamine-phosphate pyrophosphorylase
VIRYQITDGTAHRDRDRWLAAIRPDADFVQIREPHLSARELAGLVRQVSSLARVLVNDRIDVAIACGAAGVHLRSHSVSPAVVRRITPPGFIVSVACHNEEDIQQAAGADYAVLAPVFQPLSKTGEHPPLGLDAFARIVGNSPVPVIALGGITESNTALCLAAGAAGVAGITLFRRP